MKIGVNGRFMIARKTGVQRVAFNLIKQIILMDSKNEYIIFTGRGFTPDKIWDRPNVKLIVSNIYSHTPFKNHFWEQVTLPRLAASHKVDILHNPANIGPLFYSGTSIVNIYDLCFLVNPSWYSFSFRTLYRYIIPRISKNATKIITDSNNSKNDIHLYLKLEPEKVSLIYCATEDLFLEYERYLELNFPYNDYILYVGSVEPRKNIGRLLRAYERLRVENKNIKTKLIIIGCSHPLFRDERFKITRYIDDIIFQGYVSDEKLINFYAHATCCVYPSLYEGFGLPPLEAMACKTPVITSNVSSLPEAVGDAALTINPHNIEEIKDAMLKLITNKELQEELIAKGLKRVMKFNWEKAAQSTIEIYYETYKKTNKDQSFTPPPSMVNMN